MMYHRYSLICISTDILFFHVALKHTKKLLIGTVQTTQDNCVCSVRNVLFNSLCNCCSSKNYLHAHGQKYYPYYLKLSRNGLSMSFTNSDFMRFL